MAVVLAAPQVAGAGCPGCEEYTLDIPDDGGNGGNNTPAPAPAPAPAPVVPAAPTTTVPTETVPVAPVVPAEPEKKPKPKPVDTDPDPVAGAALEPVSLKGIPAVTAAETAGAAEAGADGGILPLALAMGIVGLVGLALGLRKDGRAGEG